MPFPYKNIYGNVIPTRSRTTTELSTSASLFMEESLMPVWTMMMLVMMMLILASCSLWHGCDVPFFSTAISRSK